MKRFITILLCGMLYAPLSALAQWDLHHIPGGVNLETIIVNESTPSVVQGLWMVEKNSGAYTVRFEGSALPSGIYLLRLEAGGEVSVGKVVLLK